jgi:hypothetical protein
MINQIVDAYVTPSYFAELRREGNPGLAKIQGTESPSEQQVTSFVESATRKIRIDDVDYGFFSGPTSFLIVLASPDGQDTGRTNVMMQFEDFGWKVTRVYLPVEKMIAEHDHAASAPKESAQEPATSTTKSDAMPTSEHYPGQPFLLPEGKTSSLEEAQELLIILGYDAGAADGKMDEKTKAALQKFAASEGLAFDGNVSDDLLARLRKRTGALPR